MKKNLFIITLKWGVILGLALSLIYFLRTLGDLEYLAINPILNMMQVLAFIATLLSGMKEYRHKLLDGSITFTKAFSSGVLIVFFSFLLVAVYLAFQHYYIKEIKFMSHCIDLGFGLLLAVFVSLYVYDGKKTEENNEKMIENENVENGEQ